MQRIVLIGAGGHCKVIIDLIKSNSEFEIVGVTDQVQKDSSICSIPIIGDDTVLQGLRKKEVNYAFICIGALENMQVRNSLFNQLKSIGYSLPVLIHPRTTIATDSNIQEGTCVMAGAIINPGARIGKNSIINTGAIIEHDCIVGNNVQVAPGVILAGGVKISNDTFIGMGSSIIQGVNIGSNVLIGAGAVVLNDLPDNSVAVGVPARIIEFRD